MVHLYWDFERKELKKFDSLKRIEFIEKLKNKLNIPVGSMSGFDKPYIEIESNDPVCNHLLFGENMIPRAGFITRIAVRHLTYQSDEFVKKIQKIAEEVFR